MESSRSTLSLDYESLQSKLEEQESLLIQSARYGKELLDRNTELYTELEEKTSSFTERLEKLKDENHSLSCRLEQKCRMESEYEIEIDSFRKQISRQKNELKVLGELRDQSSNLSLLKQRLREVETLNDKYELDISQLQSQVVDKDSSISNLQEQLNRLQESVNESLNDEAAKLAEELQSTQQINTQLKEKLTESENQLAHSLKQTETFRANVVKVQSELDEANNQIHNLSNSYMALTEEHQELRAEMDVQAMNDRDHKTKGNSMFTELDDKRQKAEKALMLLHSRHGLLQNQYELSKKHIVKLKMQLSMMLQVASGQVDSRHVSDLEGQLSDARTEIKSLQNKLHKLEKSGAYTKAGEVDVGSEGTDNSTIQYLNQMLVTKQAEVTSMTSDLHERELMYSHVNQILSETQHSLRQAESRAAKLNAVNLRLNVQVEQMKASLAKLSEQNGASDGRISKGKVETIPGFSADVANAFINGASNANQDQPTPNETPSPDRTRSTRRSSDSSTIERQSTETNRLLSDTSISSRHSETTSTFSVDDRENVSPNDSSFPTSPRKARQPSTGMQSYLRHVKSIEEAREKYPEFDHSLEENVPFSEAKQNSHNRGEMDSQASCKVIDVKDSDNPDGCKTQ